MAPLPIATTRELGLNSVRIERAYALMRQWTTGPDAPWPAAAIAIGRRGRMLESRSFGRQGPEAEAPPLRPDNIFLIASLTKPITCLGAMLLVERGLMNHPTGSDSLCDLLGPGAFGHIGATGTTVWCDPRTESFCVLFTSTPRDDAPWRLVAVSNAVAAALE